MRGKYSKCIRRGRPACQSPTLAQHVKGKGDPQLGEGNENMLKHLRKAKFLALVYTRTPSCWNTCSLLYRSRSNIASHTSVKPIHGRHSQLEPARTSILKQASTNPDLVDSHNHLSFSSKPWPPPDPPPPPPGGPKDRYKHPKIIWSLSYAMTIPVFLCHPVVFFHHLYYPSLPLRLGFVIVVVVVVLSSPQPSVFCGRRHGWSSIGMSSWHVPHKTSHLGGCRRRRPHLSVFNDMESAGIVKRTITKACSDSALAIPVHVPPYIAQQTSSHQEHQAVETVSTEIYNTLTFRNQCCQRQGRLQSQCCPKARLSVCLSPPRISLPLEQSSVRPPSETRAPRQCPARTDHPFPSCCRRRPGLVHRMRHHHAGVSKNICCAKKMQLRRRLHRTKPSHPLLRLLRT